MRAPAAVPSGPPAPVRAAVTLAVAAAAALVFHGSLAYFFSQDDFAGLARARGLEPRLSGPWRYLSGQVYFDLMHAWAGLDAWKYHAASLVAHLGASVLLLFLLWRLGTPWAAWVGATFFAVHPALYTAVYSVSGIGEILAGGLGVATVLAASGRGRSRWWSVPLFVASLGCKESLLLAPLALLARPHALVARPSAVRRDALPWVLAACSAAYLLLFLAGDTFGVRAGLAADEAYALRFDGTLGANLITYLGWTANFLLPTARSFSDAVDPAVFGWGAVAAALMLAGVLSPALRAAGSGFGAAWFLAALLPVLPLANHTYHYYLYAPLAGAAVCLTAALSRWGGRRGAARAAGAAGPAWALAAAAAGLLTVNGALLVRKVETFPFLRSEMRADPTVDRARIAARVAESLRDAPLPAGVTMRFWSPGSIAEARAAGGDAAVETYWERNVRGALLDGLAVRVLRPEVSRVEFVRDFAPAGNSVRYAIYAFDGRLRVATPGELDSLLRERPEAR
jgi:hypothetical protein